MIQNMPIALQLFSVRDELAADFRGTLQKVKDLGYEGVEFAGLHGRDPQEIRAMLDDIGLKGMSAHVPLDELLADIDKVVEDYKTLGCRYIAVPWLDEARRYLTNIVGKYGPHIQLLLGKAAGILDQIKYICPLHGPVWRENLGYFIDKYDKWSRYEPEVKGVMIAYASMYGNTEAAAQALAAKLCEKGITDVAVYDVSNTHVSYLISEAFKYSHIALASVTYNLGIYPVMKNFLEDMKALNMQNRTFALIENGSWACKSGDLMQKFIDEEMKNMTVLNERLSMASSLSGDKAAELETLADALAESVRTA